jgi:DNA-binding MarR family transcriptional regulator
MSRTRKPIEPTAAQLSTIDHLLQGLDQFLTLRHTMTVRHAHAFLLVARKEAQSVDEYARQAQCSSTTMGRALGDLGDHSRNFEEGAGLIIGRQDLLDRRRTTYELTHKGRVFLLALTQRFK